MSTPTTTALSPSTPAADKAAAEKEERSRQWKIENAEAIRCWNRYVEENGLPLAKYRMF